MELGALTAMTFGFRERELVLDLFELITGLRMNHAYVRPGGVAHDLPDGAEKAIAEQLTLLRKRFKDTSDLLVDNAIWMGRTVGVGYMDLQACMALGMSGPVLRATGLPHDLRKTQPYCGYENYEFDVCTQTTSDAYGRFLIRLAEMQQSCNIVEQCLDRLTPGPIMVADKKIAWPSQLSIGADGMGQSAEHVRHIMDQSMKPSSTTSNWSPKGSRCRPGRSTPPWSRRVANWCPHRQRRRYPAVPGALPRPVVHQPASGPDHVRGRHGGRRGRRRRQHRPGHGWGRPMTTGTSRSLRCR